MRCALIGAALARPTTASIIPRTAFLSSSSSTIRFSSTESTPSTQTPQARPYAVGLTNSNLYPVYLRTKAAGSTKLTLVKKVQGDSKALVKDLAMALDVPKEDMRINPVTKHIEVKGYHLEKVKEFLMTTLGDPKPSNTTQTEVKV